jgi:hypothetical protein
MSEELNKDYENAFAVSVPSVYVIRIFILGKNNFYINWIASWELLDIIFFGATFLAINFLVKKILDTFYPSNKQD